MADIKLKDLNKLTEWNSKELRKLRITINNRLNEFEDSSKPREFKDNHPLHQLGPDDCKKLLDKVKKAEKEISRT